ncbi:hypothetical protein HYALB_00002682 [Hymenoscyphus albidus]|uniref:Uncharacterized protein n=1 Tax=Hymenoscyphus albidus TaxID=595503 RepID=A0A9N9M2Y8_9HELO|nr:hypothetical protein HYALB_00002682 [Hymenoscyphus albidus]
MSDPPSSNHNFHLPTRTLNEAIENEYDDKYGEERFLTVAQREERDSKTSHQISHQMGAIIDTIQAENGLKEFAWESLFYKARDSPVFWDAVWRSSRTLEKLNLVFNKHELYKIAEIVSLTSFFMVPERLT